jgi:iron complex transport system substrate-binding protein
VTPRIASLVPAGTDIAVALGLADCLVGVSHECDNPRVAGRGQPLLTRAHVAAAPLAPPGEVDKAVVDALTAGEPLYSTDLDLLRSLEPTVILAQDICDVCALPAGSLGGPGMELPVAPTVLSATSLSGLEDDLLSVAERGLRHDDAVALISRLRAIRVEVAGRIGGARRKRVLTLEWGDPPFVGGHWVPELVGTAGGDHLLVEPGDRSVRSTWDVVGAADPEVIVFMPCGYGLEQAAAEGAGLVGRVPQAEWWAVDAAAHFSRCTPAAVSNGLHVMAGILHPELCPPPRADQARRLA